MKRWTLLAVTAWAVLGSAAGARAESPASDPLDALRAQIQEARSKRDFTRAELEKLLATTPPGPYMCPTGEVWPAFENGAPHSRQTVLLLRAMYHQQKDRWKRYHLLTALSHEKEANLRSFWLERLQDPKLPPQSEWAVVQGLCKVGTEADLKALAKRLGAAPAWDTAILNLLGQRPELADRSLLLARFRDRKALGCMRGRTLRVLLRLGGDTQALLSEARKDPDPQLRAEAAAAKD